MGRLLAVRYALLLEMVLRWDGFVHVLVVVVASSNDKQQQQPTCQGTRVVLTLHSNCARLCRVQEHHLNRFFLLGVAALSYSYS